MLYEVITDFDLDGVTSLVVVDANNWKRLDKMDELAEREGLVITSYSIHYTKLYE